MGMGVSRSVDATAGGAFCSVVQGKFCGARLVAGSNAAKATIREVDGSGAILAVLSAGAALASDEFSPFQAVVYSTALHVTITGTSPQLNLFVE